MVSISELNRLYKKHLRDAEILFENERWDGAYYLCGYALEIKLKARICQSLNWDNFPQTRSEFEKYKTFKTHELDVLLHLSGSENEIRSSHLADWSIASEWNPTVRYEPDKIKTKANASDMIKSTKQLITELNKHG